RFRMSRLLGRALDAVLVAIEAQARLATEPAGGIVLRGQYRRAEPWLIVELAIDGFHHRMRDIEAGEVEQLEGAEPEPLAVECDLLAQDAIDRDGVGHAFADRADRFRTIGPTGVVD